MMNAETSTLVLKDEADEYYLVPQATLERGRVPAEHRAELEQLLADSGDVSGHSAIGIGIGVGLIVVGVGLVIYGQSIDDSGPTTGQLIQQMVDAGNRVRQQGGRAP